MITQGQAILQHLERCGSITPLEALNEYGCMRLGARIWDLKRAGHRIETRTVTRMTEGGETKRFAEYRLKKDGD